MTQARASIYRTISGRVSMTSAVLAALVGVTAIVVLNDTFTSRAQELLRGHTLETASLVTHHLRDAIVGVIDATESGDEKAKRAAQARLMRQIQEVSHKASGLEFIAVLDPKGAPLVGGWSEAQEGPGVGSRWSRERKSFLAELEAYHAPGGDASVGTEIPIHRFDAKGEKKERVAQVRVMPTSREGGATAASNPLGNLVFVIVLFLVVGLAAYLVVKSSLGGFDDVAETLEQMAGGNLTQEVDTEGALETLRIRRALNVASLRIRTALDDMGKRVHELRTVSEALTSLSQERTSSIEETDARITLVSGAAHDVDKRVNEVAVSAEEMLVNVDEIARNTAEVTEVGTAAASKAEDTTHAIDKLQLSSQALADVIEVIGNITEQTNLLSLNATIEAARAGQAGRGFAVVANEIKILARETASSTYDIAEKVEAIQTDTKNAVMVMKDIQGIIWRVNEIQTVIASAVGRQSTIARSMGDNLSTAVQSMQKITQHLRLLLQTIQSITDSSPMLEGSLDDIRGLTTTMEHMCEQFQT